MHAGDERRLNAALAERTRVVAVCGGCLLNKIYNYEFQNSILKILTLPIFLLWSSTELARVALGYVGNIKERVPMISAFLLLTIFPQLVAVLFFTFLQDPVLIPPEATLCPLVNSISFTPLVELRFSPSTLLLARQ